MGDQWVDIPLPTTSESAQDVSFELTNCVALRNPPGSELPYAIRHTPGIRQKATPGSGATRGMLVHQDYVWLVRGTQLYRWDGTTSTLVGTVSGSNFVQTVGCGPNQIAIVDGAGNEYVATTAAVSAITPPSGDFGDVTFMDGYIIAFRVGTDEFYISALDGTTFGALDFSTADAVSDVLVGCYVHNRELFLLGKRHIEVWVNTGASPFPFQRAVPGVIDKGCFAVGSIAHYGQSMFFMGQDWRIYRLDGYTPTPVSDEVVEANLRTFVASPNNIRAGVFVDRGNPFYFITPNAATAGFSYVYNIKEGGWHAHVHSDGGSTDLAYVDTGEFVFATEARNICALYSSSAAGGFDNGIYELTGIYQNVGSLGSVTQTRIVSLGPIQPASGNRVFEHEIELTMGNLASGTRTANLHTFSDDGPSQFDHGDLTSTSTRIAWVRCGSFRKRSYMFTFESDDNFVVHRLRHRIDGGL